MYTVETVITEIEWKTMPSWVWDLVSFSPEEDYYVFTDINERNLIKLLLVLDAECTVYA